MTTVNEAAGNAQSQLAAELAAGVKLLSGNQAITFTLYVRKTLPTDGFVFWINANLISFPIDEDYPYQQIIQGSLHYSTETEQETTSSIDYNTIVFTALEACDIFNEIDPQYLYLASYNGIRFSFNSQGKFYQQANLWHYVGIAVTPVMETQIIDTLEDLQAMINNQIVSNSLPIWLAMPEYRPPYPGFVCPIKHMFPSNLVPGNFRPPYAAIDIEDTNALTEVALLGKRLESGQLTSEKVTVTTYGVNNADIITFLNFVIQYSGDWNFIGMRNMPTIRDEKLTQPELGIIAQKKSIEFRVNYLQHVARNIFRQHIFGVIVGNQFSNVPFVKAQPPHVQPYKTTMKSKVAIKSKVLQEQLNERA